MVRYVTFGFIMLIALNDIQAQKSFQPKQADTEWKGIIYRKEETGVLSVHTNGMNFAYHSGKIKTYYNTSYYTIEAGYLRDPREYSQNRNIPVSFGKVSRSFRFGKQNSVFTIRAGKGIKRLISDKARRRGVALGYNIEAGPVLAVLKPYYLELIYDYIQDGQVYSQLREERYTAENAAKFLDYNAVFGGGSFNRGWNQISIIPGAQAKLGFFVSPGAFESFAKSVEIGIMGDLFIRKLPIMVETPQVNNTALFLNVYAALELGRRKY
jgi:hypothetical protein